MSKIALVTGANTGIGFEAVRGLLQPGFVVYLAARDTAKGEAAAAAARSRRRRARKSSSSLLPCKAGIPASSSITMEQN